MTKIDNTIQLGRCIQTILEENEEVLAIVGDVSKIFGLRMPKELVFPFVHYERLGMIVNYTKDNGYLNGWSDEITFSIGCVSNDYEQSIDLGNAVRHAIEGYQWHEAGFMWFDPIEITNVIEYETNEMFVQEIQIRISAQPC